jgi:hypothetical protein
VGVEEDELGDRADSNLAHRALLAPAEDDAIESLRLGDFDESTARMAVDAPDFGPG